MKSFGPFHNYIIPLTGVILGDFFGSKSRTFEAVHCACVAHRQYISRRIRTIVGEMHKMTKLDGETLLPPFAKKKVSVCVLMHIKWYTINWHNFFCSFR